MDAPALGIHKLFDTVGSDLSLIITSVALLLLTPMMRLFAREGLKLTAHDAEFGLKFLDPGPWLIFKLVLTLR